MVDYTSGVMPLNQVHKPPFSIEASGYEKVPGETIPRIHPLAKDGLRNTPHEGVHTIYDLVCRSARIYPNHHAVGYRELVKMHKETKMVSKNVDGEVRQVEKEWQFFELSPFTYLTYSEYIDRAHQLGAGLRKLGITQEHKLHLFATTSVNWISMSHGCASQSIPIVTAYDTLGEEGVAHSLLQTQADAMYVDPHLLKTATGPIRRSKVKTVIVNTKSVFAAGGEIDAFKKENPDLNVITYDELVKLGKENPIDPTPPKGSDLYCVMYTSGSSGLPKGACIKHESLVAGVTGLWLAVGECVSDKEFVLAYLPLAHIFEMALENLVILIGGTLGYGSSRTLSDTSVKNCAGDMREFRPTVLVGVPQVWETIKKGIVGKVDTSSPLIKNLFWGAFNYKTFMSRNNLPGMSLLDGIVFKKVRDLTGGRLRFIMNGASGLASDTKHFLSMVLAPLLIGYGLTETCANGSLGCPLEYTPESIGPVSPALEIKLVAMPDQGYTTDEGTPQGEIYMRGMPIMYEYYDNPEETSKAVTSDGWFKTGDVGEFDASGHLKVIDRVKNLVKMQGGEYVALEKLEAVYRGSSNVVNIMVLADPNHSRPIAIIMPNEAVLAEEAKKLGVPEHDMHTDHKVNSLVLKDLQATGRRGGLNGIEIVAGVVITDAEWTPPSGLVTATQKLNRKTIESTFSKQIQECLKHI